MAGSGQDGDAQPRRLDDLTVEQRGAVAAQELGGLRAHRGSGGLHQMVDATGVVVVLVGDEREGDVPAGLPDQRLGVLAILRTRVHQNVFRGAGCAQQPGIGALQRHSAGIVGQHHGGGRSHLPQSTVRGMGERHLYVLMHGARCVQG
ncbi:hypothetical protein NS14008_37355 [Nocardia seriolae]|nr:hypothetical protein NS14008_37355 [Nocardia seriolae]